MRNKLIPTVIILVLVVFLLSSCAGVSQEDYNKVSNDLVVAQAKIRSLEVSEAKLKRQLEEVRQNLDSLNSQLLTLQSERDSLNMEVAALRKQLLPSPDHAASEADIWGNPEFMSVTWKDRDWEYQSKVEEIGRTYHRMHTYIPNETDCNDMAVDLWNMLFTEGIKSAIVVGNLDIGYAKFSECNHAWLIVFDAEGKYSVLEPTTGEVFYKPIPESYAKFSFIYKTPSALWSDLKKKW